MRPPSQRLKLTIAYDGTFFAGWQSQAHGNSVQDHLERAFKRISGDSVRVHGAGRTDAGVHALAQCAHVDVKPGTLLPARWTAALNALLPPAIRVLRTERVSSKFHARFSATGKVYRYRVWSGPVLPPHEYGRAWHVIAPLEMENIRTAADRFLGKHDFAEFAANRGKSEKDSVRTIQAVKVRRRGHHLTVEFAGDGFLYKMVRLIMGALVQCGTGRTRPEAIAARLRGHKDHAARLAAPAAGLFLVRVRY